MPQAVLHPRRLAEDSLDLLATLNRRRALLGEQVRRDLVDQHAGQVFGGLWVVVHPLFIMMVYVFVFAVVFQARVGGTREMPLNYTSYILSGLGVWLALVQSLSKTSGALTGNAGLIKQVVFPIEVLPVKAALATMVPLSVMLGVYFAYTIGVEGQVMWTQALLPVLLVIYALWTTGLGLLLASVTVFVRDVRELVSLFTVAGVFLLPVIYVPEWVPPLFKPLLYVNPFSYVIWCFQDALYFGRFEHPWAWVVAIGGGLAIFGLGARTFRGLKPYFGDAL
jgi:lipopolysaccharide transport system permease protein